MKKKVKALEILWHVGVRSTLNQLIPPAKAALVAPVLEKHLKRHADGQFQLSISLIGEAKMKKLNHEFRQKNYATDVLSFPQWPNIRGEGVQMAGSIGLLGLGDIIICVPTAKKQAVELKVSLEDELLHLIVHGFLHLLGYDHEISPEEAKLMERQEAAVLADMSKLKKSRKKV